MGRGRPDNTGREQVGLTALELFDQWPICFESVTLIQPQYKDGALKGLARGQCLNCMDEQEYDLTKPANREDLIHVIEAVTPKADVRLTALIGRNRPKADLQLLNIPRLIFLLDLFFFEKHSIVINFCFDFVVCHHDIH